MEPDISIIIPVYNEQENINPALERLRSLAFSGSLQIIIVDGHPDHTTLKVLGGKEGLEVICLHSAPGRGIQLNRGAEAAKGKILLFLHCDSILPSGALDAIMQTMADQSFCGGAFDLCIDDPLKIFRMIEKSASVRSRLTRIPYGDQAVFIRRAFFHDIGGFAHIPLMEDVDLMRRIKKKGRRIRILDQKVATSARRWRKEGILFGTFRNWLLITLYYLGVSPDRLAKFYRTHKK